MASDAGDRRGRPACCSTRRRGRASRFPDADPLLAVTIYDTRGDARVPGPGRPRTLPAERAGAGPLFVTPSPLGLRLVYLEPIAAASRDPRAARIRRGRARADAGPRRRRLLLTTSEYVMPTRASAGLAAAARSRASGAARAGAHAFAVTAPQGAPLLDAVDRARRPGARRARACGGRRGDRHRRAGGHRCCCSPDRCSTPAPARARRGARSSSTLPSSW